VGFIGYNLVRYFYCLFSVKFHGRASLTVRGYRVSAVGAQACRLYIFVSHQRWGTARYSASRCYEVQ